MSDSLKPHGLPIGHQAPWSMEFSRKEYWNVLPFPTPEDIPKQGMELAAVVSPALAGESFPSGAA